MKTQRMAIVPTAILSLLAASNLSAATHYVSCGSANPTPPYTNWATAALTIQDAVDAAAPGDEIVVTNGVYQSGSRSLSLLNTNVSPPQMMTVWSSRVVVTNAIRLESVNGPGVTVLDGGLKLNAGGVAIAGVRCVYLGEGAVLSGFTLTNGMAGPLGSPSGTHGTGDGGGVLAASSAVVTNCVIAGNLAQGGGSGACGGTLYNCVLTNNPGKWTTGLGGAYGSYVVGGGVSGSTLYHCLLAGNSSTGDGGGARMCVLNDCDLISNWADYSGGGASESVLNDCRLTGNSADYGEGGGGAAFSVLTNCAIIANSSWRGGGVSGSTLMSCVLRDNRGDMGGGACESVLYNCALIRNAAQYGGGAAYSRLTNCTLTANMAGWADLAFWDGSGGGAYQSTLANSIVYGNQGPAGAENYDLDTSLSYCCTTPLPTNGLGNIAVDPQFASLTHLSATSPCLRAGSMACAIGTDIDGEPWANPPSIGCDEHPLEGIRGPLAVNLEANYTNVPVGYVASLTALVDGPTSQIVWDFADGSRATNQPLVTHAWSAPGEYQVTLRAFNEDHPDGVSASLTLRVDNGVHCVDAASTRPVPPYTSWATAASNIQDAVDVSAPGTLILVTNGIYATGGRMVAGALANRVTLDRPLKLLSVNGPEFTIIDGGGAVRCVSLYNGSSLSGFTLTNGRAETGAGVCLGTWIKLVVGWSSWHSSRSAVVSNCLITANEAMCGGGACGSTLYNCTLTANRAQGADDAVGGGAYASTLNNCALSGNSAVWAGGGVSSCALTNCTLTGNSAWVAGGAYWSSLNNCIVLFNTAPSGVENYQNATLNYCCTAPMPTNGLGNITSPPLFVDTNGWSNLRLQANSPCINAGNNAYVTTTADLDANERIVGGTVDIGAYEWIAAPTHYVSPTSTNPLTPYRSWSTAALTIQDAVDAAAPGDEIVVTNGAYQTGARAVYGMSNRVAVTKPVIVRSVNGPSMTHVVGSGPKGPAAVRCAYLTNGAVLAGFTLTNGTTQTAGDDFTNQSGGGVWCEGLSAVVSNCVLTANFACMYGGGAYSGRLSYCVISNNSAMSEYYAVSRGGGVMSSTLDYCLLVGNAAAGGGGGDSSTLNHCVLSGNYGILCGGAGSSTLNQCTLTDNHGQFYGGAEFCTLNNCIIYYNSSVLLDANYDSGSTLNYSCTTPLPTNGLGNIVNAPAFVNKNGGSNLRLQANSPCINAGNNAFASGDTDLDGNPRISGATVDIGAYEFQGEGLSGFPAWLWQYGQRIDGSADAADPDQDLLNNQQEWVCATCPTNSQSALRLLLLATAGTNLVVTWSSVAGMNYYLERTTNLASPFSLLATNLVGQEGFTSFEDTNCMGAGPFFYRVGVSCR
jgi:hypothetical protein